MFKSPAEDVNKFNTDVYHKEAKNGLRGAFFDEFGGLEAMYGIFSTDPATGVDESEANEQPPFKTRKDYWGDNIMPQPKSKWLIEIIWEHCQDETIIILTIAAAVSLALGLAFPETYYNPDCNCTETDATAWVEGVAIIVAVIVIIMVGSLQDWDKERKV